MLSRAQLDTYAETGHLTVDGVFGGARMAAAAADAAEWAESELAAMDEADEFWYLDRGVEDRKVLRKLDNPVALRAGFRDLAASPELTGLVSQLIGNGLKVLFSQIFFKPPGGGGPKPVHQDNFYFGPDDPDGMVTAWIALDDADAENGCLYYGDGSHRHGIIDHVAPPDRPYDLLIPAENAQTVPMSAAPVGLGGVSFHHGTTLHQSSDNRSDRWRRACAIHFANGSTVLRSPALPYDETLFVTID